MGSNSKHPKIQEDRISNLPSSLISHILSFLPTKYAVRTSSLSTFWYNQWASVTHLRFNDSSGLGITTSPETKANFVTFVYRVLLQLKTVCPHIFQLHCRQDYGVRHVNSWISAALSRHFQLMDLSFSIFVPGFIPRSLYSSRTLIVLKLGSRFLLKVPMSISLDSLRILHLSVQFLDNDSLNRLVSSCPVLEELKLIGIVDENVNNINILSVSLKRLILIGLNPLSEPQLYDYHVMLNTPCLQYFEHVNSRVPFSYSEEILHCLDRAHIDVGVPFRLLPPRSYTMCRSSSMTAISNVMFLYLTTASCKVFYCICHKLPKFPRLTNLELEDTDRLLLAAFLKNSPKLEILSFQYANHFSNLSINDKPLFVSSDLKKIDMKNFRGQHMELDIATYFLEKVKSLNKLLISYSLKITKEKEAEMSKKLLMVSRASTSCVVLIT